MRVARLAIQNFRGIQSAELLFDGHTLLLGRNNVGKSTICEALDLVLGPDRISRTSPVEEFDFFNSVYIRAEDQGLVELRVEVVLVDLTEELSRMCFADLEHWHSTERRLLGPGEIDQVDAAQVKPCLRLTTVGKYDPEEDQFNARTIYSAQEVAGEDLPFSVPNRVKRAIGFLYLRALRTGSRALSLERGSLLDIILRMKELRTGLWERVRTRLANLNPPIDADATELAPILDEIEGRLSDYIQTAGGERSTRLFVSQLTREHLRKTIAFFLTMGEGETPIPFQEAGTGTLNILVLALLSFIADIKKDVIFAMEEPEIALPPHTQRRIAKYLLEETAQCFITSHSPYVIERFDPEQIVRLSRNAAGVLTGIPVVLPDLMKPKSYRQAIRRALGEAMLGQGVIVAEGLTERDALRSCANIMEEAQPNLFPLDVAGITIVDAEGDGNLERLGQFFRAIGLPAFAFFDRKQRSDAEIEALRAMFDIAEESAYAGAEMLLATEVPLDRQWEFLQELRAKDAVGHYGIPPARPDDAALRTHTIRLLKGLKGAGGASQMLDLCAEPEIPARIRDFLNAIYARFPRPPRRQAVADAQEAAAAPEAAPAPEPVAAPDAGQPPGS